MGKTMKARVTTVRCEVEVTAPYRLDLTVSVLRRLPTNIVDLFTPQGEYLRALDGSRAPVVVRATQVGAATLAVTVEGPAAAHPQALASVRRMLGVERDLSHFARAARGIPWLQPLAARMRGVKPPRYPSLWEACVNAIVFQQVSLVAASTILRRMILAMSAPLDRGGVTLHAFPSLGSFADTNDSVLRAAGLSANKLAALRRVADALLTGALDETTLEGLPSQDAAALLRRIKGIGPWTATVILLRGLGRLDVFPMNDSSVAANLAVVAGSAPIDVEHILQTLSPQHGMLYYHLLLARLDARGHLPRAAVM